MPKFNILYAAQNTSGLYLEDALQQIRDDLATKNALVVHLKDPVSQHFLESNDKIATLLDQCIKIQEDAIAFSKGNTDSGKYTTTSGSVVDAHPMTWHEYLGFLGRTIYGDDLSGYLIVRDSGTINHMSSWANTKEFIDTYTSVK